MDRAIIESLHTTEYEHPLDKVTLEALRKIPLFPQLLELCMTPQSSMQRINLLGGYLRVNDNQFPSLYKILQESCQVMDVDEPLLYVSSQPQLNAYTSCPDKPIICIYGYLLDVMSDDEIRFVIGHELAHIKSRHIIYQTLGAVLGEGMLNAIMGSVPGLSSFSQAATIGLNYAYYEWSRAAEYTCDRGGFLTCQNFEAACTALMKLAGCSQRFIDELNLDEFIAQSREFTELDSSTLGAVQKIILSFGRTHPWAVSRVSELIKFRDSGVYQDILDRKTKLDVLPEEEEIPALSESVGETYEKAKNATMGAFSGMAKGFKKMTDGKTGGDNNK